MAVKGRRRLGRQADILRVFTEKVAAQGYDGTSLAEIAEELGVSKGTIMHHYGAKERLLQRVVLDYMQRRLGELDIVETTFASAPEQLAGVITTLLTAFRDDSAATRAVSREFMRFVSDPVMRDVRQLRRIYTHRVETIVERGRRAGTIRTSSAEVTTLQILGMCNWGWTWIDPSDSAAVDEIARVFSVNFLGGIVAGGSPAPAVGLPAEIVATRASGDGSSTAPAD